MRRYSHAARPMPLCQTKHVKSQTEPCPKPAEGSSATPARLEHASNTRAMYRLCQIPMTTANQTATSALSVQAFLQPLGCKTANGAHQGECCRTSLEINILMYCTLGHSQHAQHQALSTFGQPLRYVVTWYLIKAASLLGCPL